MNPLKLFQSSRSRKQLAHAPAHMTFAATSLGRSVSSTALFFKRQLWIWPILAVVMLSAIGLGVRMAIESTMKEKLRSELQTLLSVEMAMLEAWIQAQSTQAELLANDARIRERVYTLLAAREPGAESLPEAASAEIHKQLQKDLAPFLNSHNYFGYVVTDKSKRILSSSTAELIGRENVPEYDAFLTRALEGTTMVSPPFKSTVSVKDENGRAQTGVATMFVCAPVRDPSFQVVGALALRIRPELEFTRILQLGRIGESGETYAFDKAGTMVSNSRFDEMLILSGLLPDAEDAQSLLHIQIRDPQGNVTTGHRPKVRRSELPLTLMAAAATAGQPGVNVDGYRDYRGVPVIGAWTWLPRHELGVTTEIDVAEAFRPLAILQWTFWIMFGLLILSASAIFVFTIIVARMQREARKAAVEAQQLGQYTLERKLGKGAMGVVYRGYHAMLRRPTAIKMLDIDKVNNDSVQRFEREVQITCQLNHPNTIAIYDYGRTPEGVFYYAMEYLDGVSLQALVERYGPLPEARVIHILLQICGSLQEAHSMGLVHRDIKPANIMLNRRGGEPDVIKVLDFGLVKAVDNDRQAGLTSDRSLTGTPLYMSPEAIQSPETVDPRSDLYAVGAVGYFLLTGQTVFDSDSIVELCQKHLTALPESPSQRLGAVISRELEDALLACLEKSPFKRPPTARELAKRLLRCATARAWSPEEADAWWSRHERTEYDVSGTLAGSLSMGATAFNRTMVSGSTDDD